MKKGLTYGLGVAAAMAAATVLRLWQRATAFEPETGLLAPGKAATWCLVALVVLAAAGFLLLGRWLEQDVQRPGYLAAFALPLCGAVWFYALAGALVVAAGVLGILDFRMGLDPRLSRLVMSVCLCPAGVGMVLVGWRNGAKAEVAGRFAWPLLLPGYGGCLWLITCYQDRATEPNIMRYVFYLLGAVCAVLCCYTIASFSFEKPRVTATLWLGGMALVCLCMSVVADLAPEGRRLEVLVSLGYALYLAAQLGALVKNLAVPAQLEPWEPPEPQEHPEEETTQETAPAEHEVREHE